MDTFLEILQNSAQAELLGLAEGGGKPRKSRETKIASSGAAERHQGRLSRREGLGTIPSPPQSDLRPPMSLGSHAWRRLGTWPQSTLSRAAHCARAHTQRAPSQRDHNAPTTLPRVEHLLAQGRWVWEAWAMRRTDMDIKAWGLGRGPAAGGSAPAEDRFVHTQRGPRDAGAKKWRGTSPSRRRRHASRAGMPERSVVPGWRCCRR